MGTAPGGGRGDRRAALQAPIATRTSTRPCCAGGSPTASTSIPSAHRGRQRLLRDPARRRAGALRARGRDRSTPGRRSRCIRSSAPLSGAREIRVPLAGYEHDLEAMLAEITAATQLLLICNPNNPTGTYLPAARIAAFLERVPAHVTVILDEAYIELQVRRRPVRDSRPAPPLPEPGPPADLLQGLRAGRAALRLCARLGSFPRRGRCGAAAVQRQSPRPGGRSRSDHTPGRRRAPGRERGRRANRGRGGACARSGLPTAKTQTNFSWIDLGERDEAEVVEALGREGVIVRAGTPLGGPGHIRVTYGTAESENERFLEALRASGRSERGVCSATAAAARPRGTTRPQCQVCRLPTRAPSRPPLGMPAIPGLRDLARRSALGSNAQPAHSKH